MHKILTNGKRQDCQGVRHSVKSKVRTRKRHSLRFKHRFPSSSFSSQQSELPPSCAHRNPLHHLTVLIGRIYGILSLEEGSDALTDHTASWSRIHAHDTFRLYVPHLLIGLELKVLGMKKRTL